MWDNILKLLPSIIVAMQIQVKYMLNPFLVCIVICSNMSHVRYITQWQMYIDVESISDRKEGCWSPATKP